VNVLKANSYTTQTSTATTTTTTTTTVFSAPATPTSAPSNPSTPQGKDKDGSFLTPTHSPGVLTGVGNVFKKIGNSKSLTKLPKMPEGLGAAGTSAPPASSAVRAEIPYFGVPIEKIVEREGTQVPLLVTKCIEYLVRDLDEVGILRLSGSLAEINDVKDKINHGKILLFL